MEQRGIYMQDWRDESAYPKPGETTMQEWANQFASRNHQYNEWLRAWMLEKKKPDGVEIVDDMERAWITVYHDDWETRRFTIVWGIDDKTLYLLPETGQCGYVGRPLPPPTHPKHFDYRFNLEASIVVQLERARRELEQVRKLVMKKDFANSLDTKPNDEKFPLYLKLLDAEAAKAAKKEVIQALFSEPVRIGESPQSKKYDNAMRAAKLLRDGGFEKLLYAEQNCIG